jgi:deoxycytidylate deaminase
MIKTIHAEASAILSCRHKNDLAGSTIVVYRSTKDGCLALAKPCEACTKLMKIYGIKRVIYTKDNTWYEEKV